MASTEDSNSSRRPYPEEYEANHERMSVGRYLASRVTTLKPTWSIPVNPLTSLGLLSRKDWLFFSIAMAGWTWDAFDFFSVSLTVTPLAKQFGVSNTDITWGMTLVLMVRTVGAVTFGLLSDRFGRKWPFVVNCILFIIIELGTGFCQTYHQFLACRALFGVAMGAMYGNAVATALEDCPMAARGIISGLLQMGYILGYLLATAFARALVGTTSHGWRPLFWFGACPPLLILICRLFLPETDTFLERKKLRESSKEGMRTFLRETKVSFQSHWLLLVFMVLITAGLQFQTHGTQDLYPLLLQSQYGFTPNGVTVTNVIANLGAFAGGVTCGFVSDVIGRRLTLIITFVISGALLYPYCFVTTRSTAAPAFFEQFFIEGACGILPIYLLELSPGSLRAFSVGTAYQLGNLASSASSTIEATIGERFPLPEVTPGVKRYRYNLVTCIFTGCVLAYNVVVVFFGPERKDISMALEEDSDMQKVIGQNKLDEVSEPEAHDDVHEIK
ncbi:sugar transporter family protein [Xylogone sp. PMI_703]|nr:sugar transporter family protein [Xylogone sp. PMI_703]